jgi:S1-C subfamily serine protease
MLFHRVGSAAAQQPWNQPDPAASVPAPDAPAQPLHLQGLNDYIEQRAGPGEISQLGILVRDDSAELKDGGDALGAAVVKVLKSGAATGVLQAPGSSETIRTAALIGASAAAAVMFPPALIAVALIARTRIGEACDVIIGIDGDRVRNTLELAQAVEGDRSGDTVYLAIVRNGQRMQVPLRLP